MPPGQEQVAIVVDVSSVSFSSSFFFTFSFPLLPFPPLSSADTYAIARTVQIRYIPIQSFHRYSPQGASHSPEPLCRTTWEGFGR